MTIGERGIFRYNLESQTFEKVEKARPLVVEAPFVTSDEMEPTQSHADGQYYTSKTRLRETYKVSRPEAPYGYIERGDEPVKTEYTRPTEPNEDDIRDDVARALNLIKYGMAPASEKDKEIWKREQRQMQEYKRSR